MINRPATNDAHSVGSICGMRQAECGGEKPASKCRKFLFRVIDTSLDWHCTHGKPYQTANRRKRQPWRNRRKFNCEILVSSAFHAINGTICWCERTNPNAMFWLIGTVVCGWLAIYILIGSMRMTLIKSLHLCWTRLADKPGQTRVGVEIPCQFVLLSMTYLQRRICQVSNHSSDDSRHGWK